ncbi:MAG: hypothetical protein ACLQHF_02125 [Terracidiphilus sp.]
MTDRITAASRTHLCLLALIVLALAIAPRAQAQYQGSIPLNGGTLTWTANSSNPTCESGSYQQWQYSSFVYSYAYPSTFNPNDNINVTANLGGAVVYIQDSPGPQHGCPPNGPEPAGGSPLLDSTSFYRVFFTPAANGEGSATMNSFSLGGAAPKYLVASVIYAPPNPGPNPSFGPSYVSYEGTSELGTSNSWSSSFTNSSSYSTTASLLGISTSGGGGWTQETDDSTSISYNKTSSTTEAYPGIEPANVVGLNHDNDIILLWINPAIECVAEGAWNPLPTVNVPAAAQCVIFDPKQAPGDPDDPDPDTEQLPVGELNGDYSLQLLNPDTYNILQSHGITSADYPTILAADPYWTCKASITCVQNTIGVNPTRFDLQTNAPVIDFGNNGSSTQYQVVYQATTQQGQGASYSYTITNTVSGSESFIGTMSELLKSTQTWTDKWSEATTTMVGQTATVFVNEPSSGYSGPSQFEVYKDNVYGTFMLYPTQ